MAALALSRPAHLAALLRTSVRDLIHTLDQADEMYDELVIHHPEKPEPRPIYSPRGALRRWQRHFLETVLISNLPRSPHSHGGVSGRNTLTNLAVHSRSVFLFTADIQAFYPSIRRERVTRLFVSLGCSEAIAGLCTRLCTHNHCLEQGLITSPIIADYLLQPVDRRIAALCQSICVGSDRLKYTRFVDDFSVSGPFDFRSSGIPSSVGQILSDHGFKRHPHKNDFGAIDEGAAVTKLRCNKGRPDVQKSFVEKLERQLVDAERLSRGEAIEGPYYSEEQIRGRIQYVCWINPGRRKHLRVRLGRIDWSAVRAEAQRRQLVECRKVITFQSLPI